MIDLQEYIDQKLDSMNYEFRISRETLTKEAEIARDFLDEAFDTRKGEDFVNYCNLTDLQDMANTFGDSNADISYYELMEWLKSDDHDGPYYFEQAVNDCLVSTDNFDFYHTIQVAQVEEAIHAINYAQESGYLTPVIAAMFMQNQGYEKADEDLLDKMGEIMDTSNLSKSGLEKTLNDAKEELGLEDKEVGEKIKEDKNKDRDER